MKDPLGVRGFELHSWPQKTAIFRKMHNQPEGSQGADNDFAGENPPYHTPVFVLTHHGRPPLPTHGGTTFYFVTDGIEAALRQATQAAQGRDVRIGGGVSTIRQFLMAGAIDEVHLAFSPVMLGEGEHLFSGINLPQLGYRRFQTTAGEEGMHVILRRG